MRSPRASTASETWMPWAQSAPTDASVMSFLEPPIEHFGGDAAANYAITLRDSGEFVGGCGLMPRIGPARWRSATGCTRAIPPSRHRDRGSAPAHQRRTRDARCSSASKSIAMQGNIASASVARALGSAWTGSCRTRLDTPAQDRATRWSGSANDPSDGASQVIVIPARSGGSGYFGSISVRVSMSSRLTAQLRNHL